MLAAAKREKGRGTRRVGGPYNLACGTVPSRVFGVAGRTETLRRGVAVECHSHEDLFAGEKIAGPDVG